jgi:hypothetical protein
MGGPALGTPPLEKPAFQIGFSFGGGGDVATTVQRFL